MASAGCRVISFAYTSTLLDRAKGCLTTRLVARAFFLQPGYDSVPYALGKIAPAPQAVNP